MEFVNIHGGPLNISAMATKQKARPSIDKGPRHKGWIVSGFPPDMIEKARSAREAEIRNAKEQGLRAPAEFDEDSFMARTKPRKLRSKPYELHSAAVTCAAIAEREGWKRVAIIADQRA